ILRIERLPSVCPGATDILRSIEFREGFRRLAVAQTGGMHSLQEAPRPLTESTAILGVHRVPKGFQVSQSQVLLPVQRRQMSDVIGGYQLGNACGLRAACRARGWRRMPADAVMREGDVRDVGVAARHVTGRTVVRRILLEPLGRLQAAS